MRRCLEIGQGIHCKSLVSFSPEQMDLAFVIAEGKGIQEEGVGVEGEA